MKTLLNNNREMADKNAGASYDIHASTEMSMTKNNQSLCKLYFKNVSERHIIKYNLFPIE